MEMGVAHTVGLKLKTPQPILRKGMVRNEIAVKEDELERLRYELVDHDHDM